MHSNVSPSLPSISGAYLGLKLPAILLRSAYLRMLTTTLLLLADGPCKRWAPFTWLPVYVQRQEGRANSSRSPYLSRELLLPDRRRAQFGDG